MKNRSVRKIMVVAGGLLLALAAAYLLQLLFSVGSGESPMSRAFETIGRHTMRKQYDGLPQIRVVRAFTGPSQCAFWNFEATWGRCVGVGLYVRDYRPEHQSIVEAQFQTLAEKMRKPCTLLPTLGLPNEQELARDLGCGGGRKSFKLNISITSVTVLSEQVNPRDPYMWHAADHKKLYSYQIKGEF